MHNLTPWCHTSHIADAPFVARYLPPIDWWQRWIRSGMPSLQRDVRFEKHADINRCTIDAPNGTLRLTIPIQKTDSVAPLVGGILISPHGQWQHKHWHALQSSYAGSPYFDYYSDDIRPIYDNPPQLLADFNETLIYIMAHLIGLDIPTITQHICLTEPCETYYQMFAQKHRFQPNLSIADLLFCMGPESIYFL